MTAPTKFSYKRATTYYVALANGLKSDKEMDAEVSDQNMITRLFSKNSVRMVTLASIIVAILAVLHVSQRQSNAPMQELLQGCKLENRDLHRMQIAFGQAGLSDFKIKEGRVWVPQAKQGAYLAAVNGHNAIPAELKFSPDLATTDSGNPFLSRSQLEYREHARRKNQIREMVIRLPFVDQAWFEMDQAPRQNAFSNTKRSAVLSIRSTPEAQLRVAHVDTIKQMVAGAVTGLSVENVVVIDLDNGFAHQANIDELTQKQHELQLIAANQKRFYESRAQELLQDYPGVKVRVDVAVNEVAVEVDSVATIPDVAPVVPQIEAPSAGANGVVSIEVETPQQPPIIVQASTESETTIHLKKQLNVFIDVPTDTVFAVLGKPTISDQGTTARGRQASIKYQTQAKFKQLQAKIVDRLLPLFPSEIGLENQLAERGNSLDFRLLPATNQTKAMSGWTSRAQAFFEKNWPSICVLGIGAALLTLVVRRSDQLQMPPREYIDSYGTLESADSQLAVHDAADLSQRDIPNDPDAEVQLTKLIQEDPDSAAKIIETWIRDAA